MSWPTTPEKSVTVGVTFTFRDYQGQQASMRLELDRETVLGAGTTGDATLNAAIGAIGAALESQSNAIIKQAACGGTYGYQTGKGTNPTGADYPSKNDKAVLFFENSVSGEPLRLELPAPKNSATFAGDALPDNMIIAPASVADIVTAFNAHGVNTKDGPPSAVGNWAFTRGYVELGKVAKRLIAGWSSERGGN